MKICIIGCGYVGSALACHWRDLGHTVTATTRVPERIPELLPIAHRVILLENGNLAPAIEGQDAILLAVAPKRDGSYRETYLETAQRLMHHNPPYLLYTSSTSVYGDHRGATVDEETIPSPSHTNSSILLETEKTLSPACIVRLGEVVGPNRWISNKIIRMTAPLPGSGHSPVNLSALPDIVRGLDFLLTHRCQGIFNLCHDLHIPRRQLYEQVCQRHSLTPPVWDASQKGSHAGDKIVSSEKIGRIGFRCSTDSSYFTT